MNGVAQRNLRAGREMRSENTGARHLVALLQLDHFREGELSLIDGLVRRDHYWKFYETRRRHSLIGVVLIRLTRFEMLHRQPDLAVVSLDHWLQRFFERFLGFARFGSS